jgi:hypothetical protein
MMRTLTLLVATALQQAAALPRTAGPAAAAGAAVVAGTGAAEEPGLKVYKLPGSSGCELPQM